MSHTEIELEKSSRPGVVARWFCLVAGGYAVAGGLATLPGWAFDVPRLKDWFDSAITMLRAHAAG